MNHKHISLIGVVFVALLGCVSLSAQADPSSSSGRLPMRSSWTSDRVALREGDIITILIDELTQASANTNETSSRDRDRNIRLSLAGSGGGLRAANGLSTRAIGESSRRERFSTEISARIVEILPSGVARIEGVKKVQIDKHEQEVAIRGFIRPQDLSIANTIESWRVADAEILYTSNGKLVSSGGILSKILGIFGL